MDLINTSLGGNIPGILDPGGITALNGGEQTMEVDYVRVYQKADESRLHRFFRKSSRVLSHLSQYPREVVWAPYARLEHYFWRLFLGYL